MISIGLLACTLILSYYISKSICGEVSVVHANISNIAVRAPTHGNARMLRCRRKEARNIGAVVVSIVV